MSNRRWTVMIVPHGSDSPRTIAVSEGYLRTGLWAGGVVGGLVLVAALAGLGGMLMPGRFGTYDSRSLSREVRELRSRVAIFQDTLSQLVKRDERLRLLAGLPPADSEARAVALMESRLAIDSELTLPESPTPVRRLSSVARLDIDGLIDRANTLTESFAELSDSIQKTQQRFASTPSIMPTAGWLTSHFSRSRFHPVLHMSRAHEGIDVAAPMGSPIVAPASGVVARVARESGYGLIVEIDHGNGIVTKYAHCSRITVRQGQRVTRGEEIAAVGNTGLSTGPHLHYEIHVNGKVVDPLTFVLPNVITD